MKLTYKNIKNHNKTILGFTNEKECEEWLEKVIPKYKKYDRMKNDFLFSGVFGIEEKIKILKKFLGTNIQIVRNSPVQLILNGHFSF